MRISLPLVFALLATLSPSAHAGSAAPRHHECHLEEKDQAWLEHSIRAWVAVRKLVLEAPAPAKLDAIIFDPGCELTSTSAMITGQPRWTARPIGGSAVEVGLSRIPIGIVSATIEDASGTRFVMSVPSVWAKAKVPPGPLGLDRLMTAVMIHEATHVFQMNTYGTQIDQLQKANRLSDKDFNDDAIQARFGKNPDFSASIRRETELLFAAADATEIGEARRLARQARQLMRERAARYYVGDQTYQAQAEVLWLTMEGSAQWAGYRWLQLPLARKGGGLDQAESMMGFGRRGNSWTQLLGLALAMSVDRIGPDRWKQNVFGDGKLTLVELLDAGLAAGHQTRRG